MSHLIIHPAADHLVHSARRRDRPTSPPAPLIDAPRTASALAQAHAQWAGCARTHSDTAAAYWEEAARFLTAVRGGDDFLAGRFDR